MFRLSPKKSRNNPPLSASLKSSLASWTSTSSSSEAAPVEMSKMSETEAVAGAETSAPATPTKGYRGYDAGYDAGYNLKEGSLSAPATPTHVLGSTPPPAPPSTPTSAVAAALRRTSSPTVEFGRKVRRASLSLSNNLSNNLNSLTSTTTYSMISSFWAGVTIVTLFTFVATLFAIVYLNYTTPSTQIDLIGTSVNHMLTVHSPAATAEVRLLSGFDKDKTVGLRVTSGQQVELYRQLELRRAMQPLLAVDYGGVARFREDVKVAKSVSAKGLYATTDGVHFPDGSVMTTAAATAVGMVATCGGCAVGSVWLVVLLVAAVVWALVRR